MKKKPTVLDEPSEIEAELRALTGSTADYNALLADIGKQLRTLAENGHRIIMKGNKVVSVTMPAKKRLRLKRS